MSSVPPPVSFTAPRFSKDDIEKEIASLTEEEKTEIEFDKFGYYPIHKETPEMRSQGLLKLQESLQLIEEKDKREYLRALEAAPNVVQVESGPLLFLRCEEYDGKAAAIRLTNYWTLRCKAFGERAFLPLDQTGEGALTEDDIQEMRKGGVMLLESDRAGRHVIYLRRAAWNVGTRSLVLVRTKFHVLQDFSKIVTLCFANLCISIASE